MITSKAALNRSSTRAIRTYYVQLQHQNANSIPKRSFLSSLSCSHVNYLSSDTQKNAIVGIPNVNTYRDTIEATKLFSTASATHLDDTETVTKVKKKPRRRLKLDAIAVVR